MVHLLPLMYAAALVSAAPMLRRDSAIGAEIPVSAPNGIPESDPPTSAATASAVAVVSSAAVTSSAVASSSVLSASSVALTSSAASSAQTGSSWGGSSGSSESSGSSGSYEGSSGSSSSGSSGSSYKPPSGGSWESSSATTISSASWSQITHGSGSSSWSGASYGSGYNDCVQQCAASYSMPAASWTPPTATQSSSLNIGGSVGTNGVTHTIIVAPTQGVLRFVPFSTNASVGDTLEFHWGANNHTVTQSSALEVCNKTGAATAFASGEQNKGTIFSQVVNDTKPIWFYCGTPTHCEKGMFGGVNIGANSETSSSYTPLSQYVENITSSNPDIMAAWMYTKNQTSKDSFASGWGMSTDCSGMNDDQRASALQSVLYNQLTINMNPTSVNGSVFKANNALSFPMDLPALLANASPSASNNTSSAAPTGTGSSAAASSPASASSTPSPASAAGNGAGALTTSGVVVGLAAIAATLFSL